MIDNRTTLAYHAQFDCLHCDLLAARTEASYYLVYVYLQQRMMKRAIKAFQNLQLTEHHIDSLQQSAAGAGGNERGSGRRKRHGATQLAGSRRAALLRHRPADIPRPNHWPDCVLVSVRVPQLPEARIGRATVHVQCAVLRRSRCHRSRYGRLLPRACCRSTALLYKCC